VNANEAGELLLLMQGTWPRLANDEIAAQLWINDLTERCHRKIALDAFRGLRDSLDRAPTWATFWEAYRDAAQRYSNDRPELEEGETIKPDPVRFAELVEKARRSLSKRA
jgi:hypothetical protein